MDGLETGGKELRPLGSGSSTEAASSQGASQGGRPSKITPEVTKRICAALAAGATRKDAALMGGVVYETFRRWMNKGEDEMLEAIDGVLDPETSPVSGAYAFYMAVLQVEASISIRLSMVLYEAGLTDWRAALAWLERRRRAEWGLRIDIRKVPTKVLIEMLKEQFEVEEWESI